MLENEEVQNGMDDRGIIKSIITVWFKMSM